MHNAMYFLIKHGYIVIFVAVFIEQIGLPVPSGPVLLAAGALVGFHRLSLAPVLALAVAASLISDSLRFSLGRRRGGSVLKFVLQSLHRTGYLCFQDTFRLSAPWPRIAPDLEVPPKVDDRNGFQRLVDRRLAELGNGPPRISKLPAEKVVRRLSLGRYRI